MQNSLFIDGRFVAGEGHAEQIVAPASGEIYHSLPEASVVQVDAAVQAAARLQYGCTWINTHFALTNEMPHGGMKASGHGKDLSVCALEDYTVPRHIMVKF
jgi:aminobutyraldehyde dehydrogenase